MIFNALLGRISIVPVHSHQSLDFLHLGSQLPKDQETRRSAFKLTYILLNTQTQLIA
jgi:hypothetical protein